MKKFKFKNVLALALAAVVAVSVFSINSEAAVSTEAANQKRELTAEEIATIQPMFHAKEYAAYYPDVVKELGEDETVLFAHFIAFGIWEQRQPSAFFNVDAYASRNPDLQSMYGNDIIAYYIHYATHPAENGWRTIPTLQQALWNGCTVYSVYDFVKGQTGPKAGAVPVVTPNAHPFVEIK